MFPCALAACCALTMLAATAAAQTDFPSPRQTTTNQSGGISRLETDPVIISEAPAAERLSSYSLHNMPATRLNQMLIAAIDTRLGAPYVYGSSGPRVFDCSGFVWSVYQSAGISFERGSARTLWSRFAPAGQDEQFKFGTLVFFSNQTHIGIVADENGFYHASRTKGVIYSPFNQYWLERIDGFRRAPVPVETLSE